MTRKKVRLAFITNDSARKATFRKRKKGLLKKVSELSILCGIDVCAIVYSPYESQPEVWPNTSGVQRVIEQFKKIPEMERSKKTVNQETFLRQGIAKANEHLKKQLKHNREKEITELMYQCLAGKGMQNLMLADLNDFGWLIDQKLKEIYERMEDLKKTAPNQRQAAPAPSLWLPPPPQPPLQGQEEKPGPKWFTDWMNNPKENMVFDHGEHIKLPFNDNQTSIWSSVVHP